MECELCQIPISDVNYHDHELAGTTKSISVCYKCAKASNARRQQLIVLLNNTLVSDSLFRAASHTIGEYYLSNEPSENISYI